MSTLSNYSEASSSTSKCGLLFIEVCASVEPFDGLSSQIMQWIIQKYSKNADGTPMMLILNSTLELDGKLPPVIEDICVKETSVPNPENFFVRLLDWDISIRIYCLFEETAITTLCDLAKCSHNFEDFPAAKVTLLPYRALKGSWSDLIFEPPIHQKILTALARLVYMSYKASRNPSNSRIPSHCPWNGIVLLWGPPGAGKSSLCRSLAQRLSIRLKPEFPSSRLIEVDGHSLYSKYFGDSARLVAVTFGAITKLLEEEEDTLFFVLVDEIESIASSRDQDAVRNEPRDAMRAVNTLLTAVDRLRNRPNFVLLCTTNLISEIDRAFLDRVDFKWHLQSPSPRACYEILRQRYIDLEKSGWLSATLADHTDQGNATLSLFDSKDSWIVNDLPNYGIMVLRYLRIPDHPAKRLWDVAQKCEALSGRVMQRIPALSLAVHAQQTPCSLSEAMDALESAVDEELQAKEGQEAVRPAAGVIEQKAHHSPG